MRLSLSRGGLSAAVDTMGGELVSLRDKSDTEYIWQGDPAYWGGRNPLLFPIIGKLKEEQVRIGGQTFSLPKHGLARKLEFQLLEHGEDFARLELRENEGTLERYPFPFSLQVEHALTDDGFTTAIRVENTGSAPMPFTLGTHTGFNCPLFPGTVFEEYEVVFDRPETASTIPVTPQGLLSHQGALPVLKEEDTLRLDYPAFARLDTYIFEGLRSSTVRLVHRDSGRGVALDFGDFPMLGIWTMGDKRAPFLCLEGWHGCPAYEDEGGDFEEKPHCLTLQPGEGRVLSYRVTLL